MVIFRLVFAEQIFPFAACVVVSTVLVVLQEIIRLTDLFISRNVSVIDLALLIAYILPRIMSIVLPIATVLTVFMVVVRQSLDGELVALRSSGMSLWKYALAPLCFGFAVSLISLYLHMSLAPMGMALFQHKQAGIAEGYFSESVRPGKVNDYFDGKIIYMREYDKDNKRLKGLFISDRNLAAGEEIITAEYAQIGLSSEDNMLFFELYNGTIYTATLAPPSLRATNFKNLQYKLEIYSFGPAEKYALIGDSYTELKQRLDSTDAGTSIHSYAELEFYGRLINPWACLALALASVPMAIIDRRSGKASSYLRALFLIAGYFSIHIGIGNLIKDGRLEGYYLMLAPGLITIYGAFRMWFLNSTIGSITDQLRRLLSFKTQEAS